MSKLHIPSRRAHLVPWSDLVERLQQGMECPLTLVSAPAGFGKTTLLAEWLAQSGTAAAWLALEPEDNEPVRFFSYVLAALQRLYPALGNGTRSLLDAPQLLPMERVLAVLANELLACKTEDFALMLDNYHHIEAEAIHHAIAFLLDRLPLRCNSFWLPALTHRFRLRAFEPEGNWLRYAPPTSVLTTARRLPFSMR
jgi:LuxR family maltose regulon positive regulatory protein